MKKRIELVGTNLITVDGVEARHGGMLTHSGVDIAAHYADGNTLVSIDVRGQIRMWDLAEPAPQCIWLASIIPGIPTHIAITPDRSHIFVRYTDGIWGESFCSFRLSRANEWKSQLHSLHLNSFHGRVEFGSYNAVLWRDPAKLCWRLTMDTTDSGASVAVW